VGIRIITALLGIPLLIFIILSGGWILKISLSVFVLIGLYEFYKAMDKKFKPIKSIGFVFTLLYILFVASNQQFYFLFVILFLITLLLSTIFLHKKYNIVDGAITFFGFFYICILLSYIIHINNFLYGEIYIWLIFISAWGSDTAAYFTGIFLGKHKLCPSLSPKKTIEGAIGGFVGSALLSLLYGVVIQSYVNITITNFPLICAIIGGLGSIASQLGDLAASSIKRYVDIKDYGYLFPGHGGVLDRFDSILFTAPFVYYIVLLINYLMA